ncbi:NAD(P)/FAD-dependent oxidoreductase [Arthrobacter sp. MSA 4-2]|nr:NAD(P)/FAD-dependent oxidoreductase [Arthrobacter sp. MSA 4-2]
MPVPTPVEQGGIVDNEVRETDIVVIGAGQAGLSSGYYLRKHGIEPGSGFVMLDANEGPGGAWRHRWPSLTFDAAHGLHPLPGLPFDTPNPKEPSSAVVTRYYGAYEAEFGLPVLRPARVARVDRIDGGERLEVTGRGGISWRARAVINATGTWDSPYLPYYPGRDLFRGQQLHTHGFRAAPDFTGKRVLVVGGGTSAAQFLLQLNDAGASTIWSTRRPVEWLDRDFTPEWGREIEAAVNARTRAGLPPKSVVGTTGISLTAQYAAGIEAGILISRGPMRRLTEHGVELEDGTYEPVDVVLWATGFRASIDHLAPLHLREPGGGIRMDGVRVMREERLLMVGYGASASTVGATRAGRAAAGAALKVLGSREPVPAR